MDQPTVRILGIIGDSMTLLGSITLAAETLLRQWTARRDRASLDTAKLLKGSDLSLVDRAGEPINEETLEDSQIAFARRLAVVGVGLLVAGFSFLLVIRIWGA